MTAKKHHQKKGKLSDAELLKQLVILARAHLAWAVVNTKENAKDLSALPKESQSELKGKIGLPPKLTPNEQLAKKKASKKKTKNKGAPK